MNNVHGARLLFFRKLIYVCLVLGFLGVSTAYAGIGFDCKKGKAPNAKGKCVPCGHLNQPSCEPMRKGPQCFDYLEKINGKCVARGGEGQLRYSGIGFDCKPGFNINPKNKKLCTACGALNQVACEVMRKGKRCHKGLKVKHGMCVPDKNSAIAKKVSEAASVKLKEYLADIVAIVIKARNVDKDERQKNEMRVAEANYKNSSKGSTSKSGIITMSAEEAGDNNACEFGNFKSWSVGVGADGNALHGVSGEGGLAFRCADHRQGQKDAKLYGSTSLNSQLGAGASAGVTVGMWKDEFDHLSGPSHGYTVSITSAIDTVKTLKDASKLVENLKNMASVSPDMAIGVWFERKNDNKVGRFLGLTATVSGGVGIDAGGVYSKARTYQF